MKKGTQKLKYVGWGLTEEAKRLIMRREMRRQAPHFARLIKLAQLRAYGYSYEEIGRRHRISKQRVEQLLKVFRKTFVLLKH